MATMGSIRVGMRSSLGMFSVRAEWERTRALISSGGMEESEVKKALVALLATAKRRGSHDRQSKSRDSVAERWDDVMYFIVTDRTLGTDKVRYTLACLNKMGRHLPLPQRARVARSCVDLGKNNGEPNDSASVFEGVPCC